MFQILSINSAITIIAILIGKIKFTLIYFEDKNIKTNGGNAFTIID